MKQEKRHGKSNTRLYGVWSGMKERCNNPNSKNYPRYGGRGIVVCDEWKDDFMSFYEWAMANGYDETAPRGQYTIERKEYDGPYSPENCCWATIQEQERNKSTTIWVNVDGEEIRLTELAEREGLSYSTALKRYKRRKQGVVSREEYLERVQQETQGRLEATRELWSQKPHLSVRALAKEMGVSRRTAQRMKKLMQGKTE